MHATIILILLPAYNETVNELERHKLLQFCLTADHENMRITGCEICYTTYLLEGEKENMITSVKFVFR